MERIWRKENSYILGGNVNWYSNYEKQCVGSLKKLKIELPYDPAILLLGIYSEKRKLLFEKIHPPQCSLQTYL